MKIQMKMAAFVCAMAALVMGQSRAWADDAETDFTVNVTDAATHKPVTGAQVNVRSGRTRLDGITGDDGAAKMLVGIAKATTIIVTVKADGLTGIQSFLDKRTAGADGKLPDHIDVVLEKAGPVSGRVLDQDGKPIVGAKVMVEVQKKYANSNQRLSVDYTAVTTDEDGKWSFSGVPAQYDSIELGAMDRECLGEYGFVPMEKFSDTAALQNGTAVLKLTRGTPMNIEVTDKDGNPLPGAKVGYGEDRVASNVLPEEKTDGDGKLKLGIQSGVTAVITVQSPGFAPDLVRVNVGATEQTVAIKLGPGNLLEGTVIDEKGNPAARATVYIDTWREARTLNKRLQTDGVGHFMWADAPADEVFADVLTTHAEKRKVSLKAGGENTVTLDAPTVFKGTVVDAVTGEPVTKYSIVEGIGFAENQQMNWEPQQRQDPSYRADGENFQVAFSYPYPRRAVRVIADGYLPCDSTEYTVGTKEVNFVFKMTKGEPVAGIVVGTDGKPQEKVRVSLVIAGQSLQVQNGRLDDRFVQRTLFAATGADGSFILPAQKDDYTLAAITDDGYAVTPREKFMATKKLTLQKWGKVEGELRHGTKPWGGETVTASAVGIVTTTPVTIQIATKPATATTKPTATTQPVRITNPTFPPQVYFMYTAKTLDDGTFSFDHMVVGEVAFGRQVSLGGRMTGTTFWMRTKIAAGETTKVMIGGVGRPVVGRVSLPADVESAAHMFAQCTINSPIPQMKTPYPDDILTMTPEQLQGWRAKWVTTEEGIKYQAQQREAFMNIRRIPFTVNPDGSFRVDDVPEGSYTVTIQVTDLQSKDNFRGGNPLGVIYKTFEMPAVPGKVSDEPLDIGTLPMVAQVKKAGEVAPDFTVTTLDGKEWKLSDQKGKVVVLYFWSPVWGNAALPTMQKVWDAYGKDGSVVMLGLDYDSDADLAKRYAKLHDVQWNLAQSQRTSGFAMQYQMNGGAYVIGPDGKLAGIADKPEKIESTVADAVKATK